MLVAVTAGSDSVTRRAIGGLEAAGHCVRVGDQSDDLLALFSGCEAVVSLTGPLPSGRRASLPGAFREHDRRRTEGVDAVVTAALEAGCRRLVQESDTYGYADGGERWLAEGDPLDITVATEPMAVGETRAQEFSGPGRTAVVVRLGRLLGDSPTTRDHLRAVRDGRRVALGSPEGWVPVLHTDDVGEALCRALHAPAGVYNVAAEPVRRAEVLDAMAEVAGVDRVGYIAGLRRLLSGTRLEPLTRSLRICSDAFEAATGWRATRGRFDAGWLEAAAGAVLHGAAR